MFLNEFIDARKAALKDRLTAETDLVSKLLISAKMEELLMFENWILRSIRDDSDDSDAPNEETENYEDKGDDEN